MAFKKGQSGNPNGRPKGTANKTTTTIRSWIVSLIQDNQKQLEQDFADLTPERRLAFIEKVLPYLLPRVERSDEVEGAAYTTDDVVVSESEFGFGDPEIGVRQWYEREPKNGTSND